MTKAELLALTYNDINLEEKTISINKSYQRLKGKDMIMQPKTPKSIRVITMPDFLAEEFREYCSHLYGIMKKERLFRFTKSHMEHCMATGIERSGVKRIRLHDLRHSHARNRRVFLPTGIKRWTESEKYGKISIRNDIVKSEFVEESNLLVLNKLERLLTVCKVKNIDDIDLSKEFYFIGKTDEEISLVCETNDVPENTIEREDGWRGFRIQGILDFSLIGILSKLSGILADNKIGIFAVSTFNTDYILVKDADFEKSLAVLLNAGYTVI